MCIDLSDYPPYTDEISYILMQILIQILLSVKATHAHLLKTTLSQY